MTHPQAPAPQPSPAPVKGAATYGSPTAKPPRSHGTLLVITLVIAVLALVVALAGVVLAAMALGRSGDATDLATKANSKALPTAPAAEPTSAPTTADPAAPTAEPGPAASSTDISPSAQFGTAYEGQHLRVRSVSCGYSNDTYVDLDEPRVIGPEEGNSEFGYEGCDPGKINTSRPFAEVSGPAATPKDCLETIRTDPGRSPIAPKIGMTLCLVTNQNAAVAQGISQKLVFVTIDAVSVNNEVGVLNMTAKAWTVPQ